MVEAISNFPEGVSKPGFPSGLAVTVRGGYELSEQRVRVER